MKSSTQGRVPGEGLELTYIMAISVLAVTLWSGSIVNVYGAPTRLDSNETPFPLELQPPLLVDTTAAKVGAGTGAGVSTTIIDYDDAAAFNSRPSAIDSYGNPIDALKPIDTPDGRKVVSAQGLQFEIPNYANGITEITMPANDLLPPYVGELLASNRQFLNAHHYPYKPSSTYDQQQQKQQQQRKATITKMKGKTEKIEQENDTPFGYISSNINNHNNENKNVADIVDDSIYSSIVVGNYNIEQLQGKEQQTEIPQQTTEPLQEQPAQPKHNHPVEAATPQNTHQHPYQYVELNNHTQDPPFLLKTQPNYFENILPKPYKAYKKYIVGANGVNIAKNGNIRTKDGDVGISDKGYENNNIDIANIALNVYNDINASNAISSNAVNKLSSLSLLKEIPSSLTFNTFLHPNTSISLVDSSSAFPINTTTSAGTPRNIKRDKSIQTVASTLNFYSRNIPSNPLSSYFTSSSTSSTSQNYKSSPLSNGNFNYPNVPTDLKIIERIAAKYQKPTIPTIDPIAVALPQVNNTTKASPGNSASAESVTAVDVENAKLVELPTEYEQQQQLESSHTPQFLPVDETARSADSSLLPTYILELNDPDIGGPVEYKPDGTGPKVIAWDLLPPMEGESIPLTKDKKSKTSFTTTSAPSYRGNVHYTNDDTVHTAKPSKITTTITTTTTREPMITTHRTTTPNPSATTTSTTTTTTKPPPTNNTSITTEVLNSSNFYRLEAGDSYTLPPWLADIDDPDLDVAVTYVAPEDLLSYNQTVDRDLLPPLEPFDDLKNINLPAPTDIVSTTTPKPRTALITTKRPVSNTSRLNMGPPDSIPKPHWVRATTTTTTTTTIPNSATSTTRTIIKNRFISNHHKEPTLSTSSQPQTHSQTTTPIFQNQGIAITSNSVLPATLPKIQSNTFNSFNKPSTTTTVTNRINSSETETTQPFSKRPLNSVLPARQNGQYNPQPFATQSSKPTTNITTKLTRTTTTTTTAPPTVDKNPFDSATIPAWLSEFDYPDLGPGVPFIYNPEEDDSGVENDLLPPSHVPAESANSAATVKAPVFVTSPPNSFSIFQSSPSSFQHNIPSTSSFNPTSSSSTFASTTTTTATTSPSKVTLPIPSIHQVDAATNSESVTQPPILFVPPSTSLENGQNTTDAADFYALSNANRQTSSSSSNQNFAAPFEPETPSSTIVTGAVPNSASSQTKTTFTKSDDGKVLTQSVLVQQATDGQIQIARPFGFGNTFGTQQKDLQATRTNQFFSSSTGSFSSSASNSIQPTSGFGTNGFISKTISTPDTGSASSTSSTQQNTAFGSIGFGNTGLRKSGFDVIAADTGKYTGGFGGAPGVLGNGKVGFGVQPSVNSPQSPNAPPIFTGSNFPNKVIVTGTATETATATATADSNSDKYKGGFGGPPGILVPFDNVKGDKP